MSSYIHSDGGEEEEEDFGLPLRTLKLTKYLSKSPNTSSKGTSSPRRDISFENMSRNSFIHDTSATHIKGAAVSPTGRKKDRLSSGIDVHAGSNVDGRVLASEISPQGDFLPATSSPLSLKPLSLSEHEVSFSPLEVAMDADGDLGSQGVEHDKLRTNNEAGLGPTSELTLDSKETPKPPIQGSLSGTVPSDEKNDTKDLTSSTDQQRSVGEPLVTPAQHTSQDEPPKLVTRSEDENSDRLTAQSDLDSDSSSGGWETVPAIASYNVYDNKGAIQLKTYKPPKSSSSVSSRTATPSSNRLSKASFEYTKVAEEAQAFRSSSTSKKIDFLSKHKQLRKLVNSSRNGSSVSLSNGTSDHSNPTTAHASDKESYDEFEDDVEEAEELNRESQLSITKMLLSDKEKFAYLGAVTVLADQMCTDLATLCLCVDIKAKKKLAQRLQFTQKDMAAWKTTTLTRLYDHLGVTEDEIGMLDKLSLHSIQIRDLCKGLKTFQNLDNPWRENSNSPGTEKVKKGEGVDVTNSNENNNDDDDDDGNDVNPSKDNKILTPDNVKDQKKLNVDIAWTVICDLFLVFLQNSSYDSRSRTLLIKFADALGISKLEICEFEKHITDSLDMEQSTEDQIWDEKQHMKERRRKRRQKKYVYMGLAMAGGSLVLGLSGGLLAPVIGAGLAAGLSTIGISGAGGFLTGAGGTTIVALSNVAIGAQIGARGMSKRMGSVRTFEFRPFHNNRRVNLILGISGWVMGNEDDVRLPYSTVDPVEGDLYSLYWEPEMLKSTGQTISIVASEIFTQTLQQVLGATLLTALMSAVQLPMMLSKLGYLIDNPWNVSLDRAWSAGLILADTLRARNLGERPVTLVGFSLGSRVIYSCLIELCKKKALGLVENVFIFGTPVVSKKENLVMARSVVSGRFVNGYSNKDWVLAYLFRATAGGLSAVMGLSPVEDIEGIENFDCTEIVDGHMNYRKNMPKLLKKMGITVLSEEFVEVQEVMDPDEFKRKRELHNEVDAAQKKLLERKKGHKNWLPKWMKPKKSKWQTMVEEVVEDTKNEHEVSTENQKSKHKDPAIVDYGALTRELERIRAEMRKNEASSQPEADTSGEGKSLSSPATPVTQNSNTFQLLSAGKLLLPEDEQMSPHKKETIEYLFPDDI